MLRRGRADGARRARGLRDQLRRRVRRFLLEHFAKVDLVLFTNWVFPEAQEEVVLLLAEGFDEGQREVHVGVPVAGCCWAEQNAGRYHLGLRMTRP